MIGEREGLSLEKAGNVDPGRRRPTLRDVASHAGTSVKTASRVVNREGGVRDELVARVEDSVRALGYRPDDRARRLRQKSASGGTLGLVQGDVTNPFFASLFVGVEEVVSEHGYVVLAASSEGEQDRFNEIIDTFASRRVDGLIVVPVSDDLSMLRLEAEMGTPLVFIDQKPTDPIGDVVLSDHYGGSVAAVAHLIAQGHERIAFLGDDPRFFSAAERKRGWLEAHQAAGLRVDESLVREGVGKRAAAELAVGELLDSQTPPTALFTAQNFISIGAVRALHERGLHHDVAQAGFDDIDLADAIQPGLTCTPQDPIELGRSAADLLLRRIWGDDEPLREVVVPVELVLRGSGEISPHTA